MNRFAPTQTTVQIKNAIAEAGLDPKEFSVRTKRNKAGEYVDWTITEKIRLQAHHFTPEGIQHLIDNGVSVVAIDYRREKDEEMRCTFHLRYEGEFAAFIQYGIGGRVHRTRQYLQK